MPRNKSNKKYPSPRTRNLCNQRFSKLHVIGFARYSKRQQAEWLCKCDCGKFTIIAADFLWRGHTQSCGCLVGDTVKKRSTTHGMSKTSTYGIYCDAKKRCENSKHEYYADYGGRGIEFRFNSFEEFYAEVGDRPSDKLTIDRIDNDGHYEKGNVAWHTRRVQSRNTRRNHHITALGQTKLLIEWSELTGIDSPTIRRRLDYGFCSDCAVSLPIRGRCVHKVKDCSS